MLTPAPPVSWLQLYISCRYAEPAFKMEKEVLAGKLQGSMYGVIPNEHYQEEESNPAKASSVSVS